jgi:hypothetical protein
MSLPRTTKFADTRKVGEMMVVVILNRERDLVVIHNMGNELTA